MTFAVLLGLLLKIAGVEWASFSDDKPANNAYREGLRTMAKLYVDVGSEGKVVSKELDPILLAVIGYEESRHRPKVRDGDCIHPNSGTVCNAVGVMQLSRSTPGVLANIDPSWKGIQIDKLRDPETAVKGAYRLLQYWKEKCPGTPAHWLGAWSAGKCFPKPIRLGVRRCALAKGLADAAGVPMEACPKPTDARHTLRLIAALKAKPDDAAVPAATTK
jgi:hypothetical protein